VTLNITLVTQYAVVQASDRRMTTVDGGVEDDDANKAVVVRCSDGILAVTFTGIGKAGNERVDLWLGRLLLDAGLPELSVKDVPEAMSKAATDWFSTFPGHWEKRHIFTIAGLLRKDGSAKPVVWYVHNCLGHDGSMLAVADNGFKVNRFDPTGRKAALSITGLAQAVSRNDRRRLQAGLRSAKRIEDTEKALVLCIRRAADKPQWRWGIGSNCMVVSLGRRLEARAMYYPASPEEGARGPLFAWYEGGLNLLAGDMQASPGTTVGYSFGGVRFQVGVPHMTGRERIQPVTPVAERLQFLFRMGDSKHHPNDEVRDIPVVQWLDA
jgi:hypothetical protein